MKYYIKISVPLTLLILLVFSSIRENSKVSKAERLDYENFLKEHLFNNRPHMSKRDWKKKYAKKDRPDLAAEQNFLMTLDPATGQVPRERLIQAFEQAEISKASRAVTVEWVEHGPDNVGGRTRAVMFDPNDSEGEKFWAGGVTGGLWFTDDITLTDPSWNKIDDFWDNVAISCIAYDPTNTQIFYVGTGEIYTNAIRGFGIWKTVDGGTTWSRLTSTNDFYWVNDIVVRDENGTGVVYAAAGMNYYQGEWHYGTRGMLRSTNGGTTWSQVWSGENENLFQPSDLDIDTNNNLWAGTRNNAWGVGGGQILKSNDGTTWSTVYTTGDANRMELACAPSNANVVYAVGSGGSGDDDIGVFVKSTDGGTTWSSVTIPLNTNGNHFTRGQAWYDLILAVAPDDANVIYAGGIDLHKSIDSGNTWNQISHWYGGFELDYVHADQHSFAFRPGYPNTAVFGNDGGIHMTSDSGAVFTAKNSGYNVTQFYSTALHPTTGEYYFLAGSQDNGTQQFTNASGIVSTYEVTGGDGAYCFIDQTNPNYQITSYIYNNWRISSDGGNSFSNVTDDNTGRFINPADYDDNSDILYSAANADSIKRIHDVSGSYYSDYMSVTLGATASHIRASDYSANIIYVGTSSGSLYKISNANSSSPSSTEITGTSFPTAWISCVELGASDSEILVIFSNFGVTSVWYSVDAGSTWVSKEGDLPDMPVRWALFNPDNRNEVILATDIGVWSTDDLSVSSPAWTASNSGLANVRVDMLQIRASDGLVTAATHGRGLFSTDDFASSIILPTNDTLLTDYTFMTYNLLNYEDEDDRESYYQEIIGEIQPDLIVCQEIVGTTGYDHFLDDVLNVIQPNEWSGADFTNQTAGQDIALYYKPEFFSFISTAIINTAQSSGTRNVVEWVMEHVESGVQFRVYGVHLKASSGDTNAQQRLQETTILRNYLNELPSGSHFIVGGDFNIYSNNSSSEPAFDMLTAAGSDTDGQLFDPINRIGHWHNNSAFADVHTQSPRTTQFGGGSHGGMDDRFDWIFASAAVLENTYDMNYIDDSYLAFGNDGQHFNQAINSGTNSAVSQTMADALHAASDHLPVFATFVIAQASDLFFSEYIEGSSYNKALEIFNQSDTTVDLANYRIAWATNGNGWQYWHTFPSGSSIADGDVWVITNDQADASIQAVADEVLFYPSVVHHNGDDARGLEKTTDSGTTWTLIDIIGDPDNDPGSGWDVAGTTNGTQNHTLVRKSTVNSGNTDWSTSAGTTTDNSTWIVYDQNYFDNLGFHLGPFPYILITNDTLVVLEDSSSTIDLLDNDLILNITSFTLAIVDSANNGTIALVGDTALTYTPNANFFGYDTVSYRVFSSESVDTGLVFITVTAVNDAPVASAGTVTTNEDIEFSGTLSASDVDGDSLTYSITTSPSNGSLSIIGNTTILSFDGSDDYVDITYPISSGTSDITYSIWFKLNNLTSQYILGSQSESGDLFELYYNSGNGNFQFMIRNGTYTNIEGGSISAGSWYHAAMVRDYDDLLKLYINGNQVAASITPTGSLNPSIRIGVESGSSEYLNGYIDEFAIWDDALTTNEISAIYNSGSGLSASSNSGNYTSSSNLQGYWNFNEGTGTTLNDQTSNNNDGTIYGATWDTDSGIGVTNNSFTYSPTANYNGSDSFVFSASDGTLSDTATVSITITAVDDIPIASNYTVTTDENTDYSGTLMASDGDGDALTFSIIDSTVNGTVTLSDPATGTFTYSPVENFNGLDSLLFSASDGILLDTGSVTIVVTTIDDLPVVANPLPDITVNEDASDTTLGDLKNVFLDVDDELIYSHVVNDTLLVFVSVTNDTVTLQFLADANGSTEIVFTATNPTTRASVSDTALVTVLPMNDAPEIISSFPDTSMVEDETLSLFIQVYDMDGDSLTIYGGSDTGAVNVNWDGDLITMTSAVDWNGSAGITVIVMDDSSAGDTANFTLTVDPANDPPEEFSVIYPTVSDTFSTHADNDTLIQFHWGKSNDVDSDVTYKLTIELEFFGNTYIDIHENISDTTIGVSSNSLDNLLGGLDIDETELRWYINALDEEYTVVSDTGEFVLSRAELGVGEGLSIPEVFALHQNYPNPFNPVTTLRYDLPENSHVTITIYDMLGKQVKTLINQTQGAGYRSVIWDATNDYGKPVSAGIYLYQIQAGEYISTKKMVLLK